MEAFVKDTSPNAYEKVVDRLLASEHWGEHRGRYWLDAARYADTHGLHIDNYREMWPYRDWVIKAFNQNMPFDQFTLEQIAGDLLPNPTMDQLIATGFHRCNVTTNEGGVIPEEVEAIYAKDRVDTTGTVFLGLTVGCATCHDHKFDPDLAKRLLLDGGVLPEHDAESAGRQHLRYTAHHCRARSRRIGHDGSSSPRKRHG